MAIIISSLQLLGVWVSPLAIVGAIKLWPRREPPVVCVECAEQLARRR